jgi:hypothetical protein
MELRKRESRGTSGILPDVVDALTPNAEAESQEGKGRKNRNRAEPETKFDRRLNSHE